MSPQEPEWVALYRSALLELNLDVFNHKINEALCAINERLSVIDGSPTMREERQALQDALRNLRLLRRTEARR